MAVVERNEDTGIRIPDDDSVRVRTGALMDEGYNCAESIVRVYIESGLIDNSDASTLEMVSTGFGKGMGKTLGACGALSGAIMALNAIFARRVQKRKWVYKLSGEFTQQFEEQFAYTTCNALRRNRKLDCRELTCETAVMLNQFIARRRG